MKRAFTLIEMLVVLVILVLLLSLGSKMVGYARLASKKSKARVEMSAIDVAVKSYFTIYGKLPVRSEQHGASDIEPSESFSRTVLEILYAKSDAENPRNIIFIDPPRHNQDESFWDPWGEPYLIILDTAYDGSIEYASEQVSRRCGVVATGLYKQNKEASVEDLLKSWQ